MEMTLFYKGIIAALFLLSSFTIIPYSLNYLEKKNYPDLLDRKSKKFKISLAAHLIPFLILSCITICFKEFTSIVDLTIIFFLLVSMISILATEVQGGYILDKFTFPLILCGIGYNVYIVFFTETSFLQTPLTSVLFLLIVFGIPFIMFPKGMGFGDIKLYIAIALFFDITTVFTILSVSILFGLIYGVLATKSKIKMPFIFGPSIVYAFVICTLFDLARYLVPYLPF